MRQSTNPAPLRRPEVEAGPTLPEASSEAPRIQIPFVFRTARPVSQAGVTPHAVGLVIGEGWGCAQFLSPGGDVVHIADSKMVAGARWQCWKKRDLAEGPPQAFWVPWLTFESGVVAGRDRLCVVANNESGARCFRPPDPGEEGGHPLDAQRRWKNPQAPVPRHEWRLGGTFGCLVAQSSVDTENAIVCAGDDRFGQLGRGAGRQGSQLAHLPWGLMRSVGLGTWHGCAMALGSTVCWGRDDVGQLGVPATDRCLVEGRTVPCARAPRVGTANKFWEKGSVVAGDLFTCVAAGPYGISCWGGTRDAFFGTPSSCPESLRRAWPTPNGPVAAPMAACSTTPTAIEGVGHVLSAVGGPRGLCFQQFRPPSMVPEVHCLGAVPTPTASVYEAMISPGEDAAACGLGGGRLLCWGQGYSPPSNLSSPAEIVLERLPPIAEVAAVQSQDGLTPWAPACMARSGCSRAPTPLQPCPEDTVAVDWSEILASAPSLAGQIVSVRGPLGVGAAVNGTFNGCAMTGFAACCNQYGAPLVVGGAAETLEVPGPRCEGDESELCCDVPAYGQSVVATGRLRQGSGEFSPPNPRWVLESASLCSDRARGDR